VDNVLKGAGTVAKGPLAPPFGPYVNADVTEYAYDPAKAKAMLAAAGQPNGFKTTMLVPQSGAGMQQPVAMATIIQANLKAIGVDAQIQTTDFTAASAAWVAGNFEMSPRAYNPATGDPFGLLKAFHSGPIGTTNYNGYNNPDVDKLLDQARASQDMTQRVSLYKQAQATIVNEAPWIFVDHEILYNISAAGLTNAVTDLNGDLRVDGIGYAGAK
jgi:peptide/nickel transport system substrate-binding protein